MPVADLFVRPAEGLWSSADRVLRIKASMRRVHGSRRRVCNFLGHGLVKRRHRQQQGRSITTSHVSRHFEPARWARCRCLAVDGSVYENYHAVCDDPSSFRIPGGDRIGLVCLYALPQLVDTSSGAFSSRNGVNCTILRTTHTTDFAGPALGSLCRVFSPFARHRPTHSCSRNRSPLHPTLYDTTLASLPPCSSPLLVLSPPRPPLLQPPQPIPPASTV